MTSRQLLPLSGVAAVLLTALSFIVGGEPPDLGAPDSELVSYYGDESELQFASALLGLAGLFFLIFSAAIASLLRGVRDASSAASNVSLAGGIIFTVGLTIFAGLAFTAADAADDLDVTTLQTLNALEMNMFFTVAVGTAAFLLGTGVGALKTGLLPRWLAWAAIVLGVIAVTPLGFAAFIGLGIWTLIASAMLARRAGAPAQRDAG
ncbi:MAG TPA: hypothetical protein VIT85_04955 [Solirubrobacterales bacterium]